jgi:hypothetical protein
MELSILQPVRWSFTRALKHRREKRLVPLRNLARRIVFDDPLPRRCAHPLPGRRVFEQSRESLALAASATGTVRL